MAAKNVVAKNWALTPSYDGLCWSAYPNGDKPSGYVSNDPTYDALYDAWLATQTATNTKYVRKTGNDTTGTGTSENPYLTIGKGLSVLSAGSHLIIGNGVYDDEANWISSEQELIPSGADATHHTVIRAETRFGVRIRMTAQPTIYADGPINLASTCSYVWIDGFLAESTVANVGAGDANLTAEVIVKGTHCKVTRTLAKNASADWYGGCFNAGTGDDYNLFQDCAGFGSYRYLFRLDAGPASSPLGKYIFRRCVGFGPFGQGAQPTAVFAFYGADADAYALKKDVSFQNCFAVKSPNVEGGVDFKYGDFLLVKSSRNVTFRGCGSIGGGAEFGMFGSDNVYTGSDNVWTATDCMVVGASLGSPATVYAFRKPDGHGTCTITRYTISGHPGSNLIPDTGVTATLGLTSSVAYPTVPQSGNGASVLYAHGAFMTEYGESGYDTLQTTPLWPWPYESYIKTFFAEAITRPTLDSPASPAASETPFAGTALDGEAMTVTRYIWESAGTATPDISSYY